MRLFISSDIEGTAGIAHWDETDADKGGALYQYFREQMSREVAAACQGAQESGASAILVKDAHDSGRNLIPLMLPRGVMIHRDWSGAIGSMADALDGGFIDPAGGETFGSFDAFACTGYHSPAYDKGNPLAHTMNGSIYEIFVNGRRASEFMIHSLYAARLGVPVIFLSGDRALCEASKEWIPGLTTVAVSEGRGGASISLHPMDAAERIHDGMKSAVASLDQHKKRCLAPLPDAFEVTIRYTTHAKALKNSQYPGAKRVDEKAIRFDADDWLDVMAAFRFIL
ncbi:MAG: M55 family metallopeptidase [Oscillospiraceae bacterium]|jgi:D-amino peptidase|nr:M55 family metallopeptidase [Oscillospiraceae bacterium]